MASTLRADQDSNLRYLRGVGPKRAIALGKLGIQSVSDLFYFFPRRYDDRSNLIKISDISPGQTASFVGEILTIKFKRIPRMPILEILCGDDSGTVPILWFNQAYLKKQFSQGQKYLFHGKCDFYKNRLQISSPEFELLEDDNDSISPHNAACITPIYPLTEGLFQRSLRNTMRELIDDKLQQYIAEYLPEAFREKHSLLDLQSAIHEMHFPATIESQLAARRRIVFDEFLIFELTLLKKIERIRTLFHSLPIPSNEEMKKSYLAKLPFTLTSEQLKVLGEIEADLRLSVPMNRLLQGDVGCGKTVVAGYFLYLTACKGIQSALLAPTEILAEQHFRNLLSILESLDIRAALLTSSTPAPKRARILADLKNGRIHVLIGTHAIIQEAIQYQRLGLLVIDEQHKFGVYQRNQLLNTNPRPHQLVMTATPIPRTLALTLYGDLKISTIHSLPNGRQPIKTYWITRKKQREVLLHVLDQIKKGDQAYIIFPLIEETEKSDLFAATQEYEKLKKGVFAGTKIGLVHGRIPQEQRDATMKAFKEGSIKVLIATSVIEVGVDNPNATVMIIENAERFGLSQLHQMRGRIGRGSKPSECFLFGEPNTAEGKMRLRILTKTQDGFQIAEEDLKLRGPGDFLGTRQSGEPLFRIGNPVTDSQLLDEARNAAAELCRIRWEERPEWQGLLRFIESQQLKY